ncbi:SH3 domain-containing protein [Acidimicrobiaceae bacterium USS-CC1]|uniref:SH3 domain-containing protein n=1 Tax=Acidiferrimicrobium australe TaxID=2664430 RepID=A0ABW9QNR3_9ACTN|nr:SH3 domain-containing protein [Acidiferrimicrobium australe]
MALTVRSHRVGGRLGRLGLLPALGLAAAVVGGCNLIGHSSSPTTSSLPSSTVPATTTTLPTTTTTLPVSGPQSSGPRTVLSPLGLNVRKAPSKSAPVEGTAAQGVVLTVLHYTSSNGGWLKVKGATATGWISAQPALSAPGEFRSYRSGAFRALYPTTWRVARLRGTSAAATQSTPGAAGVATARVLFRPTSGPGDIVVSAASGVRQLPDGRAGYGFARSSQVLVCGITAQMVVFRHAGGPPPTSAASSTPEPLTYLAQVRFAVTRQRALGLYADLPDLGRTLQIFDEFVAAVTFTAPRCTG